MCNNRDHVGLFFDTSSTVWLKHCQNFIDMSIGEIAIVQIITSRLCDLLDKARKLHPTLNIEPPLATASLEQDASSVTLSASAYQSIAPTPKEHHAAVETAARNIFYSKLASCSIDDPAFVEVWILLDVLQLCADKEQCDSSLALWLIEELLDSQTIYGCRRVFDYLESRRARLITNAFSKNKQMIVLRSCNELLRRLSRAEDAVFCGRVFIFLFQSFPLGDKSAVNLRGEFHVENRTVFDEENPQSLEQDAMDLDSHGDKINDLSESTKTKDDGLSGAVKEKEESDELGIDKLYSTFWTLQAVFSNPTKVFEQQQFDAFKKGLEVTLRKFKMTPKVLQTHDAPRISSNDNKGTKRKRGEDSSELASTFNPKYLTSRDLFALEMSDLTFQRHICVQALILIDFLLHLTPRSKQKMNELKAQKAMLYPYTLSDEDTVWANNTRRDIASYLREAPDGNYYFRMVDNVLSRDKNWVRWKVESCPSIERTPIATEDYISAKAGAKRACTNKRLRANPMGAIDLSYLSDTENLNGFSTLKEPARYTAPATDTLLKEIGGIDLDLELVVSEREVERAQLVSTRASKTWRALRLASKRRLGLFEKIDEAKSLELLSSEHETQAEVQETMHSENMEIAVASDVKVDVNGVESTNDNNETLEDVVIKDGETLESSLSHEAQVVVI